MHGTEEDNTTQFCFAHALLVHTVVVVDVVVVVVVVVVDDYDYELTLSPGSNSDMVTRSSYVSPPSCLFGPILN